MYVILIEMLDVRTDAAAIFATNYRRGKIHACFRSSRVWGGCQRAKNGVLAGTYRPIHHKTQLIDALNES